MSNASLCASLPGAEHVTLLPATVAVAATAAGLSRHAANALLSESATLLSHEAASAVARAAPLAGT